MSVSFDSASTLQAATSHQCSRDVDGDGEGGRNGYPSDSKKRPCYVRNIMSTSPRITTRWKKNRLTRRKHLVQLSAEHAVDAWRRRRSVLRCRNKMMIVIESVTTKDWIQRKLMN